MYLGKLILSLGIVSLTRIATATTCSDLSHISLIGSTELHYKQVGCEKFVGQLYFDGAPYGNSWDVVFGPEWKNSSLDDEVETTTSQHRWYWSRDQQSLIHEYVIESYYKEKDLKEWGTSSVVFSLESDKVKHVLVRLSRIESKSGQVDLKSERKEDLYPRIAP
ncbi:MAG: hypothetical protein NTV34_16780 [Proteobacteria bacterium]|nr:hypothetical protein [Pseudomonadota bacterium]